MISLLRGKIADKPLGHVVIDVNGVGYGVIVPLSTYYRLGAVGEEAELKIHTSVKDTAIELFGFLSEDERAVFTLLISVAGVGPKLATNILSNVSPAEFASAVSSGELAKRKIPGIGPKLASRLVTELADKIKELGLAAAGTSEAGMLASVISALLNVGYKKAEIDERISEIEEVCSNEPEMEYALRQALRIMKKM